MRFYIKSLNSTVLSIKLTNIIIHPCLNNVETVLPVAFDCLCIHVL